MEGDVGGIGSRVEEIIGVGRWGVRESGEGGVVAGVTLNNGRSTARVSVISLSLIFLWFQRYQAVLIGGSGPAGPPPPRKWGGTSRAQANFYWAVGTAPPPPFPPRLREKGKGGKTKMVMKRPLSPGGRGWGPDL